MSRFFIRLDASPEIGLGHARRCGVLGRALMELGAEVCYALRIRNVSVGQLGLPKGSTHEVLPWDETAEDLIRFCRRHEVSCGVVDHYRQTAEYQQALLDAGLKWMQFYNPCLDMPFKGHLLHDASMDPSTALVAPEFMRERETMTHWVQREDILITFGGGDDRGGINLALDLLDQAGWHGRRIILTTSLNPRRDEIQGGEIIVDNFSPAPFMSRCRAAICAGGTTLYELATLGVPALIISIADNQIAPARAWELAGRGVYLGPAGGRLRALDDQHLQQWSNTCLSTVDGLGAKRTALKLMHLANPSLTSS